MNARLFFIALTLLVWAEIVGADTDPGAGFFDSDLDIIVRRAEKSNQDDAEKVTKFKDKLGAIVIPNLSFEDTPLSEAVDVLHRQVLELDSSNTFAASNFSTIISSTAGVSARVQPFDINNPAVERTITMDSENITATDALAEVASQAGMSYIVEPTGVVFVRGSLSDEVETVSYRYQIDLGIFRKILHTQPSGDFAQPALVKLGVGFTDRTFATFNYMDSTLLVQNTPDQIELVEKILESVSQLRVIDESELSRFVGDAAHSSGTGMSVQAGLWLLLIEVLLLVFAMRILLKRSKSRFS